MRADDPDRRLVDGAAGMTPLDRLVREMIACEGPISVARFMELALQHPQHGYYRTHDPLGVAGDFITAPEISQMFGELLGLWCATMWRQVGQPNPFILLELGPGRGTLMQDALRATRQVEGFLAALRLYLLESNETLRARQREKLGAYNPVYLDDLAALPEQPLFFIANEFFDALPIRQFVATAEGWRERRVGMEGHRLVFCDAVGPKPFVRETCPAATVILHHLAAHIDRHGGAGLVVDYGYAESSGHSTLQAVRRHRSADPLESLGATDLTAHVDFGALREAAHRAGAHVAGPLGQGEFLKNLGIDIRAARLKQKATSEQAAALETALQRLTDPRQMGTLFKVMAVLGSDEKAFGFL